MFHITQLCRQLETYFEYTTYIIQYINYIIRYFIILKDKADISQFNTPLAFLNESNLNFILKLNMNSNTIVRKYQIYLPTYNATCYK